MHTNLKNFAIAAGLGFLAVWGPSARADVLANIPSTGAASLFQSGVNNSLGDPGIFVGTDSTPSVKDGLLAFNVSSIPSGATITGATLDLFIGTVAGGGSGSVINFGPTRTISIYDESQVWGASTNAIGATTFAGHGSGSAANTGDATWNDAAHNSNSLLATLWSTGDPANYVAGTSVALATTSGIEGTTGAEVQWTSAALATEVQGWVNNPSSNNGLAVINANTTTAQTFLAFWSASGAANAGNGLAPDLAVTYVVPEPMSFSLMIFGGSMLLCRRKSRRLAK